MKSKENVVKLFRAVGVVLVLIFLYNEIFGISLIKTVSYPIMNFFSSTTNRTSDFIDNKYIHNEKDIKIRDLETENANLRKELSQNIFSKRDLEELNDLKKILKYKEEGVFENYISADIIAKSSNTFYNSFIISAGSKDGVNKGDLVLSGNGIVGIVEKTELYYSRVLSILDSNVAISFKAVRDESINGIVSQNISSEKFNNIKDGIVRGYVFDNASVLVGDMVVTSGIGEYPAGIEIGQVNDVFEDKENLLKYITIKPYTNFNDISKVMVIHSRVIN